MDCGQVDFSLTIIYCHLRILLLFKGIWFKQMIAYCNIYLVHLGCCFFFILQVSERVRSEFSTQGCYTTFNIECA
jgi:hypothetical protein